MKSPQFHKQLPVWQIERAKKLQRCCQTIKAAIQRGERIGRVIRRLSRRHHGRCFKCDPARRLALTEGTLRRMWDKWNPGENPTAFRLNYFSKPSAVPAAVLVGFAIFCSGMPQRSFASAWNLFCNQKKPVKRAAKSLNPANYSVDQIRHRFPVGTYRLMQSQLEAIATAGMELARLRAKAISDIHNRVPAFRLKRQAEINR